MEMDSPKNINLEFLNDELLSSAKPHVEEKVKSPKRNSKDNLVEKITKISQENNIELESDTKLRRMNKNQLKKKLAEVTSEAVRNQMCESVKAKPGSCDSALGLAALRMVHDMLAMSTEKGANMVLPQWGLEVSGFVDSLRVPMVREATDAAILEIAQNSELLSYVESPYARLLIAWSGAFIKSVRKKREHADELESPENYRENPV